MSSPASRWEDPSEALAPWACFPRSSRGRLVPEEESAARSPFRRDRDRIVHSQAFRRLAHKTQVFIYEEGDHYRTRLTHTIEVAQIARSLARNLGLDVDLTEAIALSHDLGHTPFGHTGEDTLAELMEAHGGFEHNAQTLRIVTHLEQRYAAFDGLNLTLETLEGVAKHNGPLTDESGQPLPTKSGGGLPFALIAFEGHRKLRLSQSAPLEAQIAAISDDIAYNTHDIDDGVRADFFQLNDLRHIRLVDRICREIDSLHPSLEHNRRMGEFSRRLITWLINDVEEATRQRVQDAGIVGVEDVRNVKTLLAHFSTETAEDVWLIRAFLFKAMYRRDEVVSLRERANDVLRRLFAHYMDKPEDLPMDWRKPAKSDLPRAVCDFIAGMTDRYALLDYARLFDDTPDLRHSAYP